MAQKRKEIVFLKIFPIDILGNKISPTDKVRKLGVIFDLVLHSLLRSILYVNRISNTYVIWPEFGVICVNQLLLHWPCNALVTSRLDYCNSLLSSISVKDFNRRQGIQNNSCQIICRLLRFSSTNCARRSLHWLPVKQRIQFRNLLLKYKSCIHVFHLI